MTLFYKTMSAFDRDVIMECGECSCSCGGLRAMAAEPEIHGIGLVGRSAAVFLLPLIAMAAGAALGREGTGQLAGALGGGFVGVVLARWIARPPHRSGEKQQV